MPHPCQYLTTLVTTILLVIIFISLQAFAQQQQQNNSTVIRPVHFTGIIDTLPGTKIFNNGDGLLGTLARLYYPVNMQLSNDKRTLFFTDSYAASVRLINLDTKIIQTFEGVVGPVDADTKLYTNYFISKYRDVNNITSTIAADNTEKIHFSPLLQTSLQIPHGIAIDHDNNYMYISEESGNIIRRINMLTRLTTIVAGAAISGFRDGPGLLAKFSKPRNAKHSNCMSLMPEMEGYA